jgi:hypothetical protein
MKNDLPRHQEARAFTNMERSDFWSEDSSNFRLPTAVEPSAERGSSLCSLFFKTSPTSGGKARSPASSTDFKEFHMFHARVLTSFHGLCSLMVAAMSLIALSARAEEPSDRVTAAAQVFKELAGSPEGLPMSVLNKASCVIILPSVKKGGFIVGAQYGKGVMTCRSGAGPCGGIGQPVSLPRSPKSGP